MAFGIDYAFGFRPDLPEQMAPANVRAVGRYVPYVGDGGKGLTKQEVEAWHAAGIDIFLYWEVEAARHRGGFAQGQQDAGLCLAAARQLDIPDDVAFFPAVDFAPGAGDFGPIASYQQGFMSEVGIMRTGIYGNYDVIEYAHDRGLAAFFCQCIAWSGGKLSPWRHVFQYVGPNIAGLHVDHLEIYGDDFGQWRSNAMLSPFEIVALFGSTERGDDGNLMPFEFRLQRAKERMQTAVDSGVSLLEQVGGLKAKVDSFQVGPPAPLGRVVLTGPLLKSEVVE